ncbi:MAG: HAMP domain-containing histidine kinase [Acidimicrobiia bacterium]|nr:HAMP domain-containing histidine kinase [Acidimicrobiia bacterium]MBT8216204.1 HAMP domain-containing histidine kinase [Acidimicrobiia bacterium]NNF10728.1 HAMP domain-containing histidine kinase [Acidimicrobiia bacterium]NNL68461.1 HAMP domain-containing histidine kinase [Acidimicrobiia bacterium]
MAKNPPPPAATTRAGRSGRALLVVTVVAIVAIAVTAAIFAFSRGTRAVTESALSLHQADDTLRVATVVRFQLGFAVHLAGLDREFGSDFSDVQELSTDEAADALEQLEIGIADLERLGASQPIREAAVDYAAVANGILDFLEEGDSRRAQLLVEGQFPTTFETLAAVLIAERNEELAAVNDSDRSTATWGNVTRFLLAAVIPLLIIILYREIVRRQQRQAELEIRLDAERQLSKAREDFIANASHELRTPLTSIYGIAQLLREEPGMPISAEEMIDIINSEASDLNRMVEDLLTTARLAAGQLRYEPEHVETEDEVEKIIGPFRRNGANVTAQVDEAVVNVDRLRQQQVLRNLVSNATKYGGPHIELRGRVDGRWFEWTIADDGEGVPAELEERLFQRFIHQHSFQQAVAGGVGLGLSIVKSLAEGMGGAVSYQRTEDETRFIVRVPLAIEQPDLKATGGWVVEEEEGAA